MIKQRTPEWYSARLGKFTASNFGDLMAKPAIRTSQLSKSSIAYIQNLALQLFLQKYLWRPDNDATRWGMRNEESALHEFAKSTGYNVTESGFLVHPSFPEVGATPDAIVVENRHSNDIILAQVKCPYSQKNHLKYGRKIKDALTLKNCKSAYHWQIQGELWVTGASHSYFVSFDPRQYGHQRLHFAKIERDQKAIDQLESVIPQAIALRDDFLRQYVNGELKVY